MEETMSEKMDAPLCRDCRWYDQQIFGEHRCTHKLAVKDYNVVVGAVRWNRCEKMRAKGANVADPYLFPAGACGPSGRLFKPRRPLWRRLLDRVRGRT
jgi:hypothetical protein